MRRRRNRMFRRTKLPWLIIITSGETMWLLHLFVGWIASALALWVVAQIMPGIRVRDFRAALVATLVIGVVNAVFGPVARLIAFPLTIVTLGLFLLVINAFLLK